MLLEKNVSSYAPPPPTKKVLRLRIRKETRGVRLRGLQTPLFVHFWYAVIQQYGAHMSIKCKFYWIPANILATMNSNWMYRRCVHHWWHHVTIWAVFRFVFALSASYVDWLWFLVWVTYLSWAVYRWCW